jgi:hypothetical protein
MITNMEPTSLIGIQTPRHSRHKHHPPSHQQCRPLRPPSGAHPRSRHPPPVPHLPLPTPAAGTHQGRKHIPAIPPNRLERPASLHPPAQLCLPPTNPRPRNLRLHRPPSMDLLPQAHRPAGGQPGEDNARHNCHHPVATGPEEGRFRAARRRHHRHPLVRDAPRPQRHVRAHHWLLDPRHLFRPRGRVSGCSAAVGRRRGPGLRSGADRLVPLDKEC